MLGFFRWIHVAFVVMLAVQLWGCGRSSKRSIRTGTPRSAVRFPTDGQLATVKSDINGVMVATMDPNSTVTQIVKASQSSRIKDYSVAFPPGAIGIATDISMAEGEAFSSEELLGSTGISGGTNILGASPPVSITATSPIDLAVPMIVALSLPTGTSLVEESLPIDRMGVIFRVTVQATGERLAGVMPASALTIQGRRILYPSKYFGWFQVTVFDKPIVESKQKDSRSLYQAVYIVPTGQPLPSCGPADIGRTIYSQEKSTFLYCIPAGWTPINLQGAQGPQGVAGAAGAPGAQGATGAAGASPVSTGFSIYDADKRRMGTLLGFTDANNQTAALVGVGSKAESNVGLVVIRLETGKYLGGFCTNNVNHRWLMSKDSCYCLYDNSSCTSPANICNIAGKTSANSIFTRSDGSWVRSSGGESVSSGGPLSYYFDGGACRALGYYQTSSYYEVTTPYTYPAGAATIPTNSLPLFIDQ